MRKVCVAVPGWAIAAAATGFAFAAHAADLSYEDPYNASVATAAVYDWTGFYVGANVGYGLGSANSADLSGAAAGLQAGFNMQSGSFVYGVEADATFTNIEQSTGPLNWEIGSLGSARLRVGYAFDRFLIYGTGGIGAGEFEISNGVLRDNQWNFGWVLGIGAEIALTNTWTARVEAFHYDIGSDTYSASGPVPVGIDATVVRAAVNYRF